MAYLMGLRRNRELADERQVLLKGLEQTRKLLSQAYSCFNTAGDPDLIESYVFEIKALQARHSYLLRQIKEVERMNLHKTEHSIC